MAYPEEVAVKENFLFAGYLMPAEGESRPIRVVRCLGCGNLLRVTEQEVHASVHAMIDQLVEDIKANKLAANPGTAP